MSKYSGVKLFEYSPAGAAAWVALRLKPDSSHTPEPQAEEDSKGHELYAGDDETYDVNCFERDKYDALRTIMKNDALVDLRITDLEDGVETLEEFSVIVSKPDGFETGSRNFFNARFKRFTI